MSLIKIENQWLKAAVDQPLHMLWAGVPWFLTFWVAEQLGNPVLAILFGAVAGGNLGFIIWREIEQWPSKRWWDPPLDWLSFGIGTGLGIWLGLR